MTRKTIVIIIMAVFAVNIGRCQEFVKGKLYFFSDTGIVAQKEKGGVLLWGRDDLAKGKSWHDADILVFLRLKYTDKMKKGMSVGGGWFKYAGMHRHGSLFVGHRDVPMFEIPTKEEIAQAEYQQQEEEKQRLAEQTKSDASLQNSGASKTSRGEFGNRPNKNGSIANSKSNEKKMIVNLRRSEPRRRLRQKSKDRKRRGKLKKNASVVIR